MERADVVVVLAKQPRPGRVKTRLQSAFTPEQAAELAGCAVRDTLRAVRSSAAPRRVLAWEGDARDFDDGVDVVAQRPGSLNDRLTGAFGDLGEPPGRRILLIGMDTPQVTAALLDCDWDGYDALLGLSEDGGFWAIGLRTPDAASRFAGIEMSTSRTGAAQLARLVSLGDTVKLLPPLRDVDEPADAEAVSRLHPWLEFARRHDELARSGGPGGADGTGGLSDPGHLFDQLYAGTAVQADDGQAGADAVLTLDRARWATAADDVDKLVVSRCRPPVLDVGCGPGRMVQALNEAGVAALGVDMSAEAIRATRARGALAVRARLADRLPAEGRWGTVLLMDGNIGIGGDVEAVLRRCRELLTAGGRIVAEVDGSPTRSDTRRVRLTEAATGRSADLDWTRMGTEPVKELASRLDLLLTEEWSAGGRVFLALQVAP